MDRDNEDDKAACPNTFTEMRAEKRQLAYRLFISIPHNV